MSKQKNCLKSGIRKRNIKNKFSNHLDEILNRNVDIFIEATGNPIIGTVHATKILKNKTFNFSKR